MKKILYNKDRIIENPPKNPVGLACSTIRRLAKIFIICVDEQKHKLEKNEGKLTCKYCGFNRPVLEEDRQRESRSALSSLLTGMVPYILECLKAAKEADKKCLPEEMELINAFLNEEETNNFFKYSSMTDADIKILRDYYENNAAYPSHVSEQLKKTEREREENNSMSQKMRDAKEKIKFNRSINNSLMLNEVRKEELIICAKNFGHKVIKLKEYPFKYFIE